MHKIATKEDLPIASERILKAIADSKITITEAKELLKMLEFHASAVKNSKGFFDF